METIHQRLARKAIESSPVSESQKRNLNAMMGAVGVPKSPMRTLRKRWLRFQQLCMQAFIRQRYEKALIDFRQHTPEWKEVKFGTGS